VTSRPTNDERGSAVVEFVALGVLLLVPLVYLVLMLARVQAGTFAVSQASREAGRAFVTADSGEHPVARARAAARVSFEDHDFDDTGHLSIRCEATPCLRPDARVRTTATVSVPLPLVPAFVRGAVPLTVPVSATHVSTVDRFRGQP
jgi:hypothetical protein